MKYIYTLILIIAFSISLFPQKNITSLKQKLDAVTSDKFFESTLIALDVYDLTDKKALYKKNEKVLLHPASNMKIITSAAGLIFLGEDYTFTTSLYYDGFLEDSVLNGNLFIVGGGDPLFTTEDLDFFVDETKKLGIKSINGNIYGDVSFIDNLFWGKGWMWDDDPSTDAPYLSALNINNNSVTITVAPGLLEQPADVSLIPSTGYFNIKNNSVTSFSSTDIYFDRDWLNRSNDIIVTGIISQSDYRKSKRVNVFRPEIYFLTLLKERMLLNNISISGIIDTLTLTDSGIHLYSFERPYKDVIYPVNKDSDNLSAEMILYALAEKFHGKPAAAENGIKLINDLLTLSSLDPSFYRLVDGSGVSHYNLLTAELINSVLKTMYYEYPELYTLLNDSFPIAGVDGSLRNRMRNSVAQNNVRAKTGTLSGVSSLSGYVTAKNGNLLAFSILIQNHVRNGARATQFQNDICIILAGYE